MSTHSPQHTALVLVDIQPDFMPGGPLACDRGDTIVGPVRKQVLSGQYGHVVATQDWHPAGHVSFASSHEGKSPFDNIMLYGVEQVLWPDHCVQGTEGAELHPGLPLERVDAIIRKGSDPRTDSYSGFRNNVGPDGERPSTGLAGWLRDRGVTTVHICGLARDVCVLWTAEDAAAAGFETHLLWDLTRPVTESSDPQTRDALKRAGVHIIDEAKGARL